MIQVDSSPGYLKIEGVIKSIDDFEMIHKAIVKMKIKSDEKLEIDIIDSFAMPSAVIGLFQKLKNKDEIKLSVIVHDRRLYELLEDLMLVDEFKIKAAYSNE